MKLQEGSILYARIDYRIEGKEADYQDIHDSMAYLQDIAKERYFLAGVFGDIKAGNIDGAMALYEAKSLEEAQKIAQDDPLIARGFYRCEIFKWNLMILSEEACQ